MKLDRHQKVTAGHLKRDAYLYVRQSTIRQVFENTESTKRQYGLREQAVSLGWPVERVIVIDNDLGQSGASAADRKGFQRLVSDVGLGRAGIVLGLEVAVMPLEMSLLNVLHHVPTDAQMLRHILDGHVPGQ